MGYLDNFKIDSSGIITGVYSNELKNIIIAYEPIWSISTSLITAYPDFYSRNWCLCTKRREVLLIPAPEIGTINFKEVLV